MKLNSSKKSELEVIGDGEIVTFSLGQKCFKVTAVYEGGFTYSYYVTYAYDLELTDAKTSVFPTRDEMIEFIELESDRKVGRPSIGVRKTVALTFSESDWSDIASLIENGHALSVSDYFRQLHHAQQHT